MLLPYYEILQEKKKIETLDVAFCLYVFWTTALAFFVKIKKWFDWYFSIICVIFYVPISLS